MIGNIDKISGTSAAIGLKCLVLSIPARRDVILCAGRTAPCSLDMSGCASTTRRSTGAPVLSTSRAAPMSVGSAAVRATARRARSTSAYA